MKLNKQTREKERLLELIEKSHQNKGLELEALIYHQGCQKLIKYGDFLASLSRVKNQNNLKPLLPKEILNVSFRPDSKFRYIRVSVNGRETIRSFCAHNRLKDLGSNVKFYHKEIQKGEEGRLQRVDLSDYKIRFNLKEEKELSSDDKLVKELMDHWFEIPKFFRYKKIFTFETLDGLFRNDFAIVKESRNEIRDMTVGEVRKYNLEDLVLKPHSFKGKFSNWWQKIKNKTKDLVQVCDQPVYYQSFQKSGTLENRPSYEIEVEYLGNQKGKNILSKIEILNKFIELVGIHLQAIQKSFFIMSDSEKDNVKKEYQQLTGLKGMNVFKAPLPVTLEVGHLQRLTNRQYLDDNNINLRKNFLVTEKADGERNLLFVNKSGRFYFINRQNLIRDMGIKMTELAGSIFDGEYIEKDKLFMIFDVYYFQGKPLWKEVFDPRYETVKKASEYMKKNMNNKSQNVEVKYPLMVGRKIFYRGDVKFKKDNLDGSDFDTLIFDACKKILSNVSQDQGGLLEIGHQYSYDVDGLIFIPSNLHVGQDYPGQIVNDYKNIHGWTKTLKWKSPKNNSIDMVTEIFHPKTQIDTNDQYFNGMLCRQVILKINYQPDYHNRYNAQRVLNEGDTQPSGLRLFSPNYPFVGYLDGNQNLIEESYIAWIPLDDNGNMITMNGEVIQDGEVVEYAYDLTQENIQHRWKPLKTRVGKKANGYHTAISIWRSINQPITLEMITGDHEIPKSTAYYQSKTDRNNYYMKEMKYFHNFVKSKLLDHLAQEKKRPYILDLCCGKLGDLYKWKNQKANFVLAVDICPDNIDNFNDGGAVRALLAQENNSSFKKLNSNLMVIRGDCSKPLNTGEAGLDALNEYYLKVLYGQVDVSDYSKLGRLSSKALQRFDIVTCNFSIHYFFSDYDRLTSFLNNVHQNVKKDGYFIGTCLDGQSIYQKMGNKDCLEQYQDPEKIKLVWRIKRQYKYNGTGMTNDQESLGMAIDVDVESIGSTSHEYLVNFDYLTKILEEYGFELVDSRLFHEVPNSMLEEFYSEVKEDGHKLKGKKMALDYSLLHRWFIFVKKGISMKTEGLSTEEEAEIFNAGIVEDSQSLTQEDEDDDKEFIIKETDIVEIPLDELDSQKQEEPEKSGYKQEYDDDEEDDE